MPLRWPGWTWTGYRRAEGDYTFNGNAPSAMAVPWPESRRRCSLRKARARYYKHPSLQPVDQGLGGAGSLRPPRLWNRAELPHHAELSFEAKLSGRFEIEIHKTEELLGTLVVEPR